jgi:hypothetical protein
MFGPDWDKAEATIVDRDAKFSGDGSTATYTFVADVRLASGETFRATIKEPTIATDFWAPSIRDTVSVLVKPNDHKVKFDKDDDRLSVKAHEVRKKAAFAATQQQPAGTPTAPWVTSAAIPEAMATKLAQLGVGAPLQVFAGDSAQGKAALAAFAQLGAPGTETPQARLEKLSTLHGLGLLTADEYAEQRHRILNEI